MKTAWTLAVDTGGTFTDCLGVSPEGRLKRAKVLSSGALRLRIKGRKDSRTLLLDLPWELPKDFFHGFRIRLAGGVDVGREVVNCDLKNYLVTLAADVGEEFDEGALVEFFTGEEPPVVGARMLTGTPGDQPLPPLTLRLGTTRGTNALLEEQGAKVALFVTRGFRHLLLIGDQKRPDLFALNIQKTKPLYQWVEEVDERIGADGSILQTLDISAVKTAAQRILQTGCRVAAVSLLNSYRNPIHERALRELFLNLGFTYVVCSENLAPFIKYLNRTQTAVVDAYLGPIMTQYLDRVEESVSEGQLSIMTSAGGLVPRNRYRAKDSLLSGPAGGVVGAVAAGSKAGISKIIPFDMGGTSTDVSRYDRQFEYRDSHKVGRARLLAPALNIETVASGGGSICGFDGEALFVGPRSAGANPGPACYGAGGPLTLTDVHLLLGRIDLQSFGIPVFEEDARKRFEELLTELPGNIVGLEAEAQILQGFLDIANERMADAIRRISVREGYDPAEYTLVAFGGAGGMHACAVGDRLGMIRILFPDEAGLLSARGLNSAVVEAFAERQLLQPYSDIADGLEKIFQELENEAIERLMADGYPREQLALRKRSSRLRFLGQESSLGVNWEKNDNFLEKFERRYRSIFGYFPSGKKVEVVSVQTLASTHGPDLEEEIFTESGQKLKPRKIIPTGVAWTGSEVALFNRESITAGSAIEGPAIISDSYSTLVVEKGWRAVAGSANSMMVTKVTGEVGAAAAAMPEVAQRELFTHRFQQIVDEMGSQLQRTALSTNIKERLDFSCGLLDPVGRLIVNAPHIPVHLGALGLCVREVARHLQFSPGDVILTNHPAFGGSHLPDVTLITPVFMDEEGECLLGFVANRAHHAEIGGSRPGSMPPEARSLAEEGVVIAPFRLFQRGRERFDNLVRILQGGPWPTRALEDNLADIKAQVAANIRGAEALLALARKYGSNTVTTYLNALRERASRLVAKRMKTLPQMPLRARQTLDDGHAIEVSLRKEADTLIVDFTGTSSRHPGNLNATAAIVNSALVYVLRLLLEENIPLNEGLLEPVRIILPECFLNPDFGQTPGNAPAVGGGNVETSQRIVDTLLLAFGVAAASQGTMNNLVFGDESFSYYETICGGSGATETAHGASAVHTHMTNTAITDPEILEHRYPVRLRRFTLRTGSGGDGKYRGGDGVVREIEFLRNSFLSLLTQRRKSGPYGMVGGLAGKPGQQYLINNLGNVEPLLPLDSRKIQAGERLVLKTPGGGGWGSPPEDE